MGFLRLRRNNAKPESKASDADTANTRGECQHCGATLLRQSNYCAVCGTSIIAAASNFTPPVSPKTPSVEHEDHEPSTRNRSRPKVILIFIVLLLLAGGAVWWFAFRTTPTAVAPRPTLTSHEAEQVAEAYLAAIQRENREEFRKLLDITGEEASRAENLLAGSPSISVTAVAIRARTTTSATDHVVDVDLTPANSTEPVRTAITIETVAPPQHQTVAFLDDLAHPRARVARSSWQSIKLDTNGPVSPIRLNGVGFDWTESLSVPPLLPLHVTSEPSPYVEPVDRQLSPGSQTISLEQKLRTESIPELIRQLNEALIRRCNSGTQSATGSCPLGFGPRSNYVYRNTIWSTDPTWMESATTTLSKTGITVSFTKLQATASYDYAPSHEPTNATAGKTSLTTQGRMELKLGDNPEQFTWAS